MHDTVDVLFDLFLVFLLARAAGEVASRIRQPPVVAEILVGVLIGPHALGLVGEGEVLRAIAELGVVFLLFEVGLENRFSDLRQVGATAATVAVSGVVVPLAAGFALLFALGHPSGESLFLGAAMVATSVGVTARVLTDMRLLREPESRVILGAAVIDDVLGLLVLAVVAGTTQGEFSAAGLLLLIAEALFFVVFLATVGTRIMRRHGSLLGRLRLREGPYAVGILVCLGVSALAGQIGLAAIVGAFLAGMVLAETREQYALEEQIKPVTNFLTPYFFVLTGMAVDPAELASPDIALLGSAVLVLAVLTKLVPCALAAWRMGRQSALIVGAGMSPRGEVGIIVASIGLASGAISQGVYGIAVGMSVLTTLIAPPLLRRLFQDRIPVDEGDIAVPSEPFGSPEPAVEDS